MSASPQKVGGIKVPNCFGGALLLSQRRVDFPKEMVGHSVFANERTPECGGLCHQYDRTLVIVDERPLLVAPCENARGFGINGHPTQCLVDGTEAKGRACPGNFFDCSPSASCLQDTPAAFGCINCHFRGISPPHEGKGNGSQTVFCEPFKVVTEGRLEPTTIGLNAINGRHPCNYPCEFCLLPRMRGSSKAGG